MPREARRKSRSKIYHIMIRGINQQNIFIDDEDYEKFIAILDTYRKKIAYGIYAYCLMGNNVHLLIKEGKEAIKRYLCPALQPKTSESRPSSAGQIPVNPSG